MAFQFDLYLTERFAVSEFHLVLFLLRQPTKTLSDLLLSSVYI